jgi:hypothetical protein
LTLSDCFVKDCATGIKVLDATVTVDTSMVRGATSYGLSVVSGDSTVAVTRSVFKTCDVGIYSADTTLTTVDGSVVGQLDDELIQPSPALRSVLRGQGRHVRLNVTDIVREALTPESTITGLAIGSFIGERLGKFTVRSDGFGDGSVARLRVYYRE